ncbi:hypothetical protein [Citrobacter freundii]|uniref:hypothetical protein n=1 Tax=Citrobacter freundii TaxID=546 RepID=UPI00388E33D7
MNEFTREELEKIADTDHVQCGDASALARMALAAMDSEPVGEFYEDGPLNWYQISEGDKVPDNRRIPLYRHAQPAQTGVDDDVRNIIGLLETNEWAEHCTETVLGSCLEAEITRLVGSSQPAPVVPDEMTPVQASRTYGGEVRGYRDGWNACRAAMLQAGNSPVTPDGWVTVPKKLTAENGAKGVLSGEFSETKFINCPECFGDDDCETCDGSGRIEITVPVSWTNIKAIWAKGVEHFEAAPQQENI